ncbi:putative reverse transcriptase domain-containing protein [Tanacetum coccineum]
MILHAIGKSKENARSSLSGWTRQGYFTCPTCNLDSPSVRVRGKTAYVGHKRFLHKNKKAFNGQIDMTRPQSFTNDDITKQLSKFPIRIPLFSVLKPCSACSRVFVGDIYRDHVVSYAGIISIKHRHNVGHDTLVDICYRYGISADRKFDIRLDRRRNKPLCPTDMLLYLWDEGLDVYVDLTGSSPFTQIGMVDFVPGQAMIDVAQRKRGKYMAMYAAIRYGFLPFSLSSLGELEANAVILLKWIRKFSMAQDIGACATVYIFNMISFAIAKGVGS